MQIFKSKVFSVWARAEKLTDQLLEKAVTEIEKGLVDANLGGNLYKKRVAKKGRGKSGGFRTILTFKKNDRVVFMYGFAKNEKENITEKEKQVYKKLAHLYLTLQEADIAKLIRNGELLEVKDEKDIKKIKKEKVISSSA